MSSFMLQLLSDSHIPATGARPWECANQIIVQGNFWYRIYLYGGLNRYDHD